MPIVSISKIQHRYGLSENLPQLSAAELGWVIDQRKLYIGNGPTAEGAPNIGNTEILTEYSNLLESTSSYTYKGEAGGYTVQSGPSALAPVTRSLQSKFDDMASVKDFGAMGDGVTDDTAAINRALYELFSREIGTQVRRSLFFPAGIYIVNDEIKIPTYAMIRGEGQDCTVIKQTDSDPSCVARTADSLQQVGANIGNNGASLPHFIDIYDMTFEQTTANHVFIINSAKNLRFHKVGFKGSLANPTTVGDNLICVAIYSTAVNFSSNIKFEQCQFLQNNFGLVIDDDVHSVTAVACKWANLYKGAKLGEGTTGAGASVEGPQAINITNCFFDSIYSNGIHAYLVSNIYSSFNYFADVGNHLAGTPYDNCVLFTDDNCASVCDSFERSDADDLTIARVELSNSRSFYLQPKEGFQNGRRQQRPAVKTTLLDNTSSATTTGVTLSATIEKASKIYYTAARGSNMRHGILSITASSAGSTISDEYQYDGADIGLTFSVDVSGGTTTLEYITTNTGSDVFFTYGVEHMNYV
jgi:hypothetical protein